MRENVAKLLAVLFGPHLWLPILLVILVAKSGLVGSSLWLIAFSMLIFQVILPMAYLFLAPKLGWIGQWEMKKKEERKPFFIFVFVLTLANLLVIYFFGNQLLLRLNLIFIILILFLFIITLFWKISLHTSLNTAAIILINFLFNWHLPWLYLILPLVYWSRLRLKRHSHLQLITGIVLTILVVFGGLRVFSLV